MPRDRRDGVGEAAVQLVVDAVEEPVHRIEIEPRREPGVAAREARANPGHRRRHRGPRLLHVQAARPRVPALPQQHPEQRDVRLEQRRVAERVAVARHQHRSGELPRDVGDVLGELALEAGSVELERGAEHQAPRRLLADDTHVGEGAPVDLRAVPVVPVREDEVAHRLPRQPADVGEDGRRGERSGAHRAALPYSFAISASSSASSRRWPSSLSTWLQRRTPCLSTRKYARCEWFFSSISTS